jgi:hypothetical protein
MKEMHGFSFVFIVIKDSTPETFAPVAQGPWPAKARENDISDEYFRAC